MRHAFLLACLFTCTGSLSASQEWFVLRLDDHRLGFVERTRDESGGVIVTRDYFRARFNRNGIPLTVTTEEIHRERADGTPLHFSYRQKLGESEMRLSGDVLNDDTMRVRVRYGESSKMRKIPWPKGALMFEGVRKRELGMSRVAGAKLNYHAFLASTLEASPIDVHILGDESVLVGEKPQRLLRIEQRVMLPSGQMRMVSHLNSAGDTLRSTLPLMGRELVMERASEHEARAANKRAEIYDYTLVAAPSGFDANWRDRNLRYRIELARNDQGTGLPQVEQSWNALGNGRFDLDVIAAGGVRASQHPGDAWLRSNTWINADDAAVARFAQRTVARLTSDRERMQRLEQAVNSRISNKSMRVGYASAADAYARREGDCTEHALLLAAAARAVGIPSRIAIGLVYAEQFGSHENVFVPHAWTQAFVDGSWRSYDAAQDGFGSDHIALAVGDGDPSAFYSSLERVGAMKIVAAGAPKDR
jgi:hypothetical protein